MLLTFARLLASCAQEMFPEPMRRVVPGVGQYERAVVAGGKSQSGPEAQLVFWGRDSGSPLHSHGKSDSVLVVLSGRLLEETYTPIVGGYTYQLRLLDPGDESHLPAGGFHAVRALEGSRSFHGYAPSTEDLLTKPTDAQLRLLEAARLVGRNGVAPWTPRG